MDRNSITAQLYTLRDFLKTPEQIYETLKRVKKIGYNAIQVSGMGPIEPHRLNAITEELGLKICATHISFERLKGDLDAVISEHKLWGCKYVGLGSMPQQFRSSDSSYLEFLEEISEVARKLHQSGLQFVYHNHKFEFEKFNGVAGLDILLSKSDPETFGFEIDTFWVQAGGANPVDWIKKVKGRMGIVHFKDMAIKADQQVFAEIGQGNLDWSSIIAACRETGVEWYAVEEDVCPGDPFESLEISFRFLEKLLYEEGIG